MKATGHVRRIDNLGRLVLPKDIRKALGIISGIDSVEFFLEEDKLVIKKYSPHCIFCGSVDNIKIFKDRNICENCLKELKN